MDKINKTGFVELSASEGMRLTDGENVASVLSCPTEQASKWREITEAEAEALLAEKANEA